MRIWARSFFSLFFHHFARIFTECDWLALAKGGVFIWCNHGHVEQTADFGFFVLCGKINSVLPVINISILWCYLFSWDIPSLISIVYYFSRKNECLWQQTMTHDRNVKILVTMSLEFIGAQRYANHECGARIKNSRVEQSLLKYAWNQSFAWNLRSLTCCLITFSQMFYWRYH